MKVRINGIEHETQENVMLLELLAEFKYSLAGIVIEYNKEIISRDQWEQIKLKAEDKLEIVAFVGGG